MEECSEPVRWLMVIFLLEGSMALVSASPGQEVIEIVDEERAGERAQEEEEEGAVVDRLGTVRRESDRRDMTARRR
jgi:hypothetical protein